MLVKDVLDLLLMSDLLQFLAIRSDVFSAYLQSAYRMPVHNLFSPERCHE